MDLDAVRTFVVAATTGKFSDAADDLRVTQQAVSKRIAALEKHLGTRLFTRTARGAQLTLDGQTFLPYAQKLLQAAEQAVASLHPGNRALRVDVIGGFLAPAGLVRDFHRVHPEIDLDIVTLPDGKTAIAAVEDGTIDATFRALTPPPSERSNTVPGRLAGRSGEHPAGRLGRGSGEWLAAPAPELASMRVFDEPLQLLTGSAHPRWADATRLTPGDLAGERIWMPGNLAGTEWAAYYDDLAAAFGFTIDTIGPNFGVDAMLDALAEHPDRATFVGAQTRLRWPAGYHLRRIDLDDPTPVYPHSLVWRTSNHHPGLTTLRTYLRLRSATPAQAEQHE